MNNRIVVQLAEPAWTTRAMHFACAMARQTASEIVLLQLVEVNNLASLGAGFEGLPVGSEQYGLARDCARIAQQYGVSVCVKRMGYATRAEALAQAVEALSAAILFAPMPQSRFSLMTKLSTWNLTHQLHGCRLYTLAGSDTPEDITPAVALKMPRHARA